MASLCGSLRAAPISPVIDFAEPKFGDDTADRLVDRLEAQEVIPRVRDVALPKTATALWDLLSSEALNRLLGRLRPLTGPIAIDEEVRHLWGRAALVGQAGVAKSRSRPLNLRSKQQLWSRSRPR